MTGAGQTVALRTAAVTCADGLLMAADVYTPGGDDGDPSLPVVVLCHGFKGFRRWGMFPPLAERLASSGRAVVLFDLSHNGVDGLGPNPDAFTRLDLFREQTVTRHVDDVGAVLDAVGSGALGLSGRDAWIVGHSMGGGVALLRAAIDDRVAGIGLLNAVSHYDRVGAEGLSELAETGQVSIPNARTGQSMPLGRAWFDDLPQHDMEAAAATLAIPALVLQGTDDGNVMPAEGEALADWIPDARLVLVPGADHTFGGKHPWAGWAEPLQAVVTELDEFLPRISA